MSEGLGDKIRRLLPNEKRGNGLLPPSKSRGPISASKGVAETPAESGGSAADLVEVLDSRTYHPISVFYASDGIITIERENSDVITMQDGDGNQYTRSYQDIQPA